METGTPISGDFSRAISNLKFQIPILHGQSLGRRRFIRFPDQKGLSHLMDFAEGLVELGHKFGAGFGRQAMAKFVGNPLGMPKPDHQPDFRQLGADRACRRIARGRRRRGAWRR